MLPFNRSWIHQLDRGRVTVRRSSGTITPYLVAQRCRTVLKGGTYGLFCRPKVPCDTQRRHLRGLFVAREHSDKLSREQNAPFRSRERLGRLSREQNAPFRSRDILGRPFREQNAAFRSRDNLGRPFREQNAPSRSRDILGRPSREQNAAFRSRDNLGRPSREQNAAFHSRDCRERHTRQPRRFFSELRELYGDSTGTLRALLDAAEVRPEPVRLIERLGAFRDGDLDG